MKSILVFLLVFSIIVVIHEFGHYFFAKRAGILVREFSLGMGPKLFSNQGKDGTTYTIRMLPLGGYVRLAGLNDEEDIEPGMQVALSLNQAGQVETIHLNEDPLAVDTLIGRVNQVDLARAMEIELIPIGQDQIQRLSVSKRANIIEKDGTKIPVAPIERRYESASVGHKILTNFAGPLNNFILSILLFTVIGFMIGEKTTDQWNIGQVTENSAAAKAGLQAGDIIVALDDQPIGSWEDLVEKTRSMPGQTVSVTVDRDQQEFETSMTIGQAKDEQTGETYGQMGIYQGYVTEPMSLSEKITYGFSQTFLVIAMVFKAIMAWFTKGFSINDLGGPVAMAQMTQEVVTYGFVPVLAFMAMLSANLGFMNLLPIPALDGGKIILNLIEGVRGKPLSQEKEGIITLIGISLLIILMVLVTWNDIMRLF
ncbi:regulator of sigma E protease [Ignavigranum ruoffiae]|uniref:Zinc metalloprotease n=1 Tax=Ignavigranum ruoffiae TaxID=89093 RepID=A0A1H8Z2X1_9LACT|nr:RIP metalloprotease RseP [Ignavigranum ruoffiae]SEP58805.1 regulator of sigma E protease [Ignavigranum ruoffiae]